MCPVRKDSLIQSSVTISILNCSDAFFVLLDPIAFAMRCVHDLFNDCATLPPCCWMSCSSDDFVWDENLPVKQKVRPAKREEEEGDEVDRVGEEAEDKDEMP